MQLCTSSLRHVHSFTEHEKSPSFHLKISFFDLQIHGSTKYPYPADNLAQSGVRIMTNVNQPQDTGYTPTQSVNIAYCGMRNSAEETLPSFPAVINTEKVKFQRGQSKIAAIQASIVSRPGGLPGFQGEGTLVLYKKTSTRCEKIKNLDKDLKNMAGHRSRTNGELTICVFILNRDHQVRQNVPDEVQNNGQDAAHQVR